MSSHAYHEWFTSKASLYIATCVCSPVRLKSSSMKSSDISAKYSWPSKEQNDEIHDSGVPEEVDILRALIFGNIPYKGACVMYSSDRAVD